MRCTLRDLTLSIQGQQILSLTLDGDFKEQFDNLQGQQILSLTLDGDFKEQFDNLRDKPLEMDLKRYRKKRSKNANDYLWALCTKIAENQGINAVEVYRKQIREAGVFEALILPGDGVERFSREWSRKGLGWFCLLIDDAYPSHCRVHAYYGSSTYNTAEMSRLINNTIEDAKALGIETATPQELSLLLDGWKKEKGEKNG